MAEEQEKAEGSIEAGVGDKRIAIRGIRVSDWIGISGLLLMVIVSYSLWEHKSDTKDGQTSFVQAIKEVSSANTAALKELTVAQRESNATGREQNCLLRFSQTERQQNAEFCKQMGVSR